MMCVILFYVMVIKPMKILLQKTLKTITIAIVKTPMFPAMYYVGIIRNGYPIDNLTSNYFHTFNEAKNRFNWLVYNYN